MRHICLKNRAAVTPDGHYVSGCSKCVSTKKQSSVFAAKYRRDRMRENARGDMLQRYDGEKVSKEWVQMHTEKAIEDLGQAEVERILRG